MGPAFFAMDVAAEAYAAVQAVAARALASSGSVLENLQPLLRVVAAREQEAAHAEMRAASAEAEVRPRLL